jgi:hypothetical protein
MSRRALFIVCCLQKAQNLAAETSASPTDTRPGTLPVTGLFSLVLVAENFDRYLSKCGKHRIEYTERGAIEYTERGAIEYRERGAIEYTERGAIEYACYYIYKFLRLFSNILCAISIR